MNSWQSDVHMNPVFRILKVKKMISHAQARVLALRKAVTQRIVYFD